MNARPNTLKNPKGIFTDVEEPVLRMLKQAAEREHRSLKALARSILMGWVEDELKEGRLERVEGYESPEEIVKR
jgi:hypothetical protein